jgi:hypothetical protein
MAKIKLDLKTVSVEVTLEALAEGLRKLSKKELGELEMLLVLDELKKRSREVRQGKIVGLSELKSLRNV